MIHALHINRSTTAFKQTIAALLLPFTFPLLASAQDKIETDRPTESLTAKTVGRHVFQVETGVRKDQQNTTDYSTKHPLVDWRYGLFDRLELRLSTAAETRRFCSENKTAYGLCR